MRSLTAATLVAGLLGCGGKPAPPVERSYTLYWSAQKTPAGGIPVKLTVPGSWKEELDAMGSPSYKLPDVDSTLPSVSLVAIPCPDQGDCMEKAISLQYAPEDLAVARRAPAGDGRAFIVQDTNTGRRRVHARLFALHPASKSAVMCVIIVMGAAGDKLPDLRRVCESLKL